MSSERHALDERLRQLVTNAPGVLPAAAAARAIFWPCFVRARQVVGGVPLLAVAAGDRVGQHFLVGMAKMRPAVDIVDRVVM